MVHRSTNLAENYPNPTFEEMISHKMNDKGLSYENALRDIISTSGKPNKEENLKYGIE